MTRLLRALLAPLLITTLLGCSRTEMAYNNLDWIIENWLDDFVDMTDAQQLSWEKNLQKALNHHRSHELPQIADMLADVEAGVKHGMDQDTLRCITERLKGGYERHVEIAVSTAVPLLSNLSTAQIDEMEAAINDRNADYQEEFIDISAKQRLADRQENLLDQIEKWTGELSEQQSKQVEQAVKRFPDLTKARFTYRKQQQAKMLTLLRTPEANAKAKANTLKTFLLAWARDGSEQPAHLVKGLDETRQATLQLIEQLAQTLNDEQKNELMENVGNLRTDLNAIAGTAAKTTPASTRNCRDSTRTADITRTTRPRE